ncbi:MAG: TPM domain-containing protein, partial [Myxococcaceae bacterium]
MLPTLALALGLWVTAAAAVPPAPTAWVTDGAGFLSPSTRAQLDERLSSYEKQTGHQVLVWIGRTTGGEPIEDFAVRAFAAWKVGRKGLDDGLVLFVMADDRAMRIEVGYGLEDQVPDAIASRVIQEILVPGFRAGDRDGAVTGAVEALLTRIEGGPLPQAVERPRAAPLTLGQIIFFGVLAVAFGVLFVTNPGLAMYLLFVLGTGGRRHGGGFGGGGGGFRGGGGRSGGGG